MLQTIFHNQLAVIYGKKRKRSKNMGLILVVSGSARAGKDTLSAFLAEQMYQILGKQFIIMAFAYELKVRVQSDFDLSWEQLWGNEKEIPDKRYPKPNHVDVYWTPREILQDYGQFFRTINNDFWVEHLFKVVEEKEYENIIITDARHKNEVKAAKDRGGYHIRVFRKSKDDIHNPNHISETALNGSDVEIDFNINNDGNLKDLENIAKNIVNSIFSLENFKGNKINRRIEKNG
jgi:hypothetical protein